uniref:Uncharacterized protein n=1 Tax=Ciona savignyi TaxID=51511 RepID=H2ZLW7_CIOSA
MEDLVQESGHSLIGENILIDNSTVTLDNNENENLLDNSVDSVNNNEDVSTLHQSENEILENGLLLEHTDIPEDMTDFTAKNDLKIKSGARLDEQDNLHGLSRQYEDLTVSEEHSEICKTFNESLDEHEPTENNISIGNDDSDVITEEPTEYIVDEPSDSTLDTLSPVETPKITPFNHIDDPVQVQSDPWEIQPCVTNDYLQEISQYSINTSPERESNNIWAKQEVPVNGVNGLPMFELMPTNPVKPISYDHDSVASVEDVDQAVQLAKIEADQVSDDPWVKMTIPKSVSAPTT